MNHVFKISFIILACLAGTSKASQEYFKASQEYFNATINLLGDDFKRTESRLTALGKIEYKKNYQEKTFRSLVKIEKDLSLNSLKDNQVRLDNLVKITQKFNKNYKENIHNKTTPLRRIAAKKVSINNAHQRSTPYTNRRNANSHISEYKPTINTSTKHSTLDGEAAFDEAAFNQQVAQFLIIKPMPQNYSMKEFLQSTSPTDRSPQK